jgi:hypothetical protein
MKKASFKILLCTVVLAFITIINTGCPSSSKKITRNPNDSTQGSPPQSINDSTQGSPPRKN